MRFVIIGAGQAAAQAVATLASEGFGGDLTVIGDEPYPPYQRPPLSKAYMAGDFVRERLFLKPDAFLRREQLRFAVGPDGDDDRSRRKVGAALGRRRNSL